MRGAWGSPIRSDQLRYPFRFARYFIPEFISRMRVSREVVDKPNPRQSMAMCGLLLPAYLRNGYLSFGDLVGIAVSTSRVEDQGLAERLACEVLLEVEETDDEPTPRGDDAMTDRICFYFSDFVLQDLGDRPQTENYEIIGRMVEQGIHVVACVSPLANGKIFSPYSKDSLERIREAGAEVIETSTPSDFLEGLQVFLENL